LAVILSSGSAFAQASLNAAPTTVAKTPGKTNVAVINMKNASGVTTGEIEVISDRLRGELFNTGKVNVMERDQMQEILKEQGFQQSGACTNEACMVEIGQLLGVEQLVTGSLGKVGSMFLVNLRVIDVKTAKIVKVVSVDIKGDIEEVVGALPGIASQLVGASTQAPQPLALEKKEEAKPAEQAKEEKRAVVEEKKEEAKPAEQVKEEKRAVVEEKKEEKASEVTDERKERNKNRFGISFGMRIFGPDLTRMYHLIEYDPTQSYDVVTQDTTYDFDKNSTATITRTLLLNYYLKGTIKAGPFITIDIGGAYSREQTDYVWPQDIKRTHTAEVYSFPTLGLNFVKRWYPFKLNVGLLADLNILSYTIDYYSWDTNNESFYKDTTLNYVTLDGGFGLRAGGEIMAGKHVGFNFDFVYYFSQFQTFSQRYEGTDSTGTTTSRSDRQWTITMPPIALGLGVNFYF